MLNIGLLLKVVDTIPWSLIFSNFMISLAMEKRSSLAVYKFLEFLTNTSTPKYLLLIGKGLDVWYQIPSESRRISHF